MAQYKYLLRIQGTRNSDSVGRWILTSSNISLVCADERQKRARPSVKAVAGNPTTTTPIFFLSKYLPKALRERKKKLTEKR